MGKYGLKIKTIEAAVLYEYNQGLRDYYDYTWAMLPNSLLHDYLESIGLSNYKGKSTEDVICVRFNFGCLSYKGQVKKLSKQIRECDDEETKEYLESLLDRVHKNKDLYEKIDVQELRKIYYRDGVVVRYNSKKGKPREIRYRMLYRTTGKAKEGSAIFIRESRIKKALNWIRMGIKLPKNNAPIVELGAYCSLTASAIVDRIKIDPSQILVLKDVDSFFRTKIVSIETDENRHCFCRDIDNYDLKNILFDGQALIDSSIFPSWAEGYILLRHHFCKMAAFHADIQEFMKDWFGADYETAEVEDMWGRKVPVRDIKLITTDNAMKWLKFDKSYDYWSEWVRKNNSMFGIVKTAHPSKIGSLQRMSYQMVNALDLRTMEGVMQESVAYIDRLKNDDEFFLEFLQKNKTFANDYEVLVALCRQDPEFVRSTYFRERRTYIVHDYMSKLKSGKLLQNGDNLVIVGNPYAMLMYGAGGNPLEDPTFEHEDGTIQCWTERFEDGEYLAEFRSPFNGRANLGYLHNHHHPLMEKYVHIGRQCIAVNMIETDFQARNNGSDMDSDSIYVTNQADIVEHARYCYSVYPTIENNIPKEKNHYGSSPEDFALVDFKIAEANSAIGESSNLAQIALTYSYNFEDRKYLNYVAMLSVLAQVSIDNAKRVYDIDLNDEILRIKNDLDIDKNGYPLFWFYIRRKGRFAALGRDSAKKKQAKNLNHSLICPMNFVCDYSIKKRIPGSKNLPMSVFFVPHELENIPRKSKRVEQLISNYSNCLFGDRLMGSADYKIQEDEFYSLIEDIRGVYLSNSYKGLVSKLVDKAFRITEDVTNDTDNVLKKNRPLLLKTLYDVNKDSLLSCFAGNIQKKAENGT